MPRRREVPKREILPDPKFGNVELAKFMNVVMTRGKKSVAENIVYGALEQITRKGGKDALGSRRLPCVDVRTDSDVPISLDWGLACHVNS